MGLVLQPTDAAILEQGFGLPPNGSGMVTESDPTPQAANRSLEVAEIYIQRGDYQSAIIELTRAVQLDPSLSLALIRRGDIKRLRGEYADALADYSKVLQSEPGNCLVLLGRGKVHSCLGQYQEAVADYTRAIQLDPRDPIAYHHRGTARADIGDLDGAIEDFTQALELDPRYAWASHGRAEAYAAKGNFERAIADYSTALELNPLAPLSYLRRADLYLQRREYEKATADYSDALRLDPMNGRAMVQRAACYYELGKLESALDDLGRALQLSRGNPRLYRQRGLLFHERREYARAISDYTAALQLEGEDGEIYFRRALSHEAAGMPESALDDLERAISLNPGHTVAFVRRGQVWAAIGKTHRAIGDFTTALRIDPRFAEAYLYRAQACNQLKCFDEAIADCDQALGLTPNSAIAYCVRGTARWLKNEYPDALADFTQAIKLEPTAAHAHYRRGLTYAKMGNLEGALHDLNEAARLEPKRAETYANRAIVYKMCGMQKQALSDLARAVRLEPRYAAAYCNQRGQLLLSEKQYEWAAAEFSIALRLDKENSAARAGWESALKGLASSAPDPNFSSEPAVKLEPFKPRASRSGSTAGTPTFCDAPAPACEQLDTAPAPISSDSHEKAAGEKELDSEKENSVEFGVTATSEQPETVAEPPIGEESYELSADPPTRHEQVKKPEQAAPRSSKSEVFDKKQRKSSPARPDTVRRKPVDKQAAFKRAEPDLHEEEQEAKEYAREQALVRARQKVEIERAMARIALTQEKQKLEKPAKESRRAKRGRRNVEDDEGLFQRFRTPLLGAAAALVLALFGYYAWGWFKIHKKIDAPLDADIVWNDYNQDPQAANQKYANHRYFIVGKLIIIQQGRGSSRTVFLQGQDDKGVQIHCNFTAFNELAEVPNGRTPDRYLISGEFQPYSEGSVVELMNCEFIGGAGRPQSAATPSFREQEFAFSSGLPAPFGIPAHRIANTIFAPTGAGYFLAYNMTPSLNAHEVQVN